MKKRSTREELEHRVVTRKQQGSSNRAIARALGVSRNTVRSIVEAHHEEREAPQSALSSSPPRAPKKRKLDAFADRIDRLRDEFADITAQRVFEELCTAGYGGGYTAVKEYIRRIKKKDKPKPSMPTIDHGPGKMSESDWSPYDITFTTIGRRKVQAFSYALPSSHRKFYSVHESADLFALMDGHVQTFERFGGCAEVTKFDSQKPVVLRWEGEQPIYNPRFLAFSTYYEFRPLAVRRGHPNDKPHVERSFWDFEISFLNGRKFRDLDDMRAQLLWWLDNVSDTRPHRELKRTPLEMFVAEAPHLIGLPRHPYDTARVSYALCSIEGYVAWQGNQYAVPFDHITDLLPVRITQAELFVYAADLSLVAQHELRPKGLGLRVGKDEYHKPVRGSAADLEQVEKTFVAMGDGAEAYFRGLKNHLPRFCGYHARQILQLRGRFSSEDIAGALRHATAFGAFDHKSVARILAVRAKPRTLAEYVADETKRRLNEESSKTEPRDLDEYDRLPVTTLTEEPCPERNDPPRTTTKRSDSDDTSKP
jgi:transposase